MLMGALRVNRYLKMGLGEEQKQLVEAFFMVCFVKISIVRLSEVEASQSEISYLIPNFDFSFKISSFSALRT